MAFVDITTNMTNTKTLQTLHHTETVFSVYKGIRNWDRNIENLMGSTGLSPYPIQMNPQWHPKGNP